MCFADITLDNPNVWFELGFAIAVGKDICIVSSEERQTKYPFDIQHRKIIKYKVESPSDYAHLGTQIEERIKAVLVQQKTRATISALTSGKQVSSEFQPFEVAYLAAIGMESGSVMGETWVAVYRIKNEMETLGFNALAANVGATQFAARRIRRSQGNLVRARRTFRRLPSYTAWLGLDHQEHLGAQSQDAAEESRSSVRLR